MEAEGEAARVEGAPPAALVGEKRKADDTPNASDVDAAASPPVKALAVQTAKSGSEQYPIASFSLSAPGARTSNGRSMPSFPRKLHQTTLPFAPSPDRRPKDTAPPCSPSSPASDKATPPPLLRDATQILEPDLPVDPAPPPHVPLQPPVVLTPPEPKPKWKGLDNYGNTCYVNVIVQALFFCPGFREALSRFVNATEDMLAGETEQNIRRRPPRGMQLMGSLNSLLQCMDPDVGPPSLTPQLSNFLKEMRSVDKRFQGTRQQDAQEFLNFMLLTLHAVATEFSKPPPPPSATRRLASLSDSDTSLDENTSTPSETQTAPAATPQRSFISDMFEGKLEMRIKCLECECASSKPEPFMDLSLSLLGNRSARTLEELLQDFFHTEKLNGSDKFFCDNCHAKTEARKGYVFASLPPILTLHLKRFSYDHRKICTHLRPPFETTFSNYCRDPGPMLVYRLYAVVFHAGYYANSGHYKCVVRRDKQWLGFDDDEVTALSESEISSLFPEDGEGSSTAYILFYHLYDPTRDNAAAVSAAELLSSLAPGSVVMAEPHHGDEAHVQSLLNELNAEESASNRPPPPPASAANRTTLPPPLPSVPEPPPPDLSLPATLDPDAPVDLPPLPRLPSQTDALMRDVSDVMDTSSVRTHATQDSTSDRMQL